MVIADEAMRHMEELNAVIRRTREAEEARLAVGAISLEERLRVDHLLLQEAEGVLVVGTEEDKESEEDRRRVDTSPILSTAHPLSCNSTTPPCHLTRRPKSPININNSESG